MQPAPRSRLRLPPRLRRPRQLPVRAGVETILAACWIAGCLSFKTGIAAPALYLICHHRHSTFCMYACTVLSNALWHLPTLIIGESGIITTGPLLNPCSCSAYPCCFHADKNACRDLAWCRRDAAMTTTPAPTTTAAPSPTPATSPPPATNTCPAVVNDILNITSTYRLNNACDLLTVTRDGLQNTTSGFQADCSEFNDTASVDFCNRFNADENAQKALGRAILDASDTQAKQCANCLQASARPDGTVGFARTFSPPLAYAPVALPIGETKAKGNSRNLLQVQPSCAGVAPCYAACPDCQGYAADCGLQGKAAKLAACFAASQATKAALATMIGAQCVKLGLLCGPAEPECTGICLVVYPFLAGSVVSKACNALPNPTCDALKSGCDACSARTGLCSNLGTTQCCVGETGVTCGDDCCCCPRCFAPGGPDCECLPVACIGP